jgi:hypothetical protein
MDEIIRKVTEIQDSTLPKIMTYADNIVKWEPNKSSLEKNIQRVVAVCEEFGLSVNLDKCVVMKISWKTGSMENTKCNSHGIKK